MRPLYEIQSDLEHILENGFIVDPETGEITDNTDAEKRLEELQIERDQKIEGIACYIKDLRGDIAKLKAEEMALAKRRKEKENKAESISRFLLRCMSNMDMKKVETARAVVQVRPSQAVEITDEFLLSVFAAETQNNALFRSKAPEPNKEEIKRMLKAGKDVPGAKLVIRESVNIK